MIFYKTEISKRLLISNPKILDLGCGTKSIFEDTDLDHSNIEAIDFSPVAISAARVNSSINYKELDLALPDALSHSQYDLVFDSHCLHCITDRAQREISLNNIHQSLKPEGLFAAEMMVTSKNTKGSIPNKYVVETRDLELELTAHGFKIIYFMIVRDSVFENANGECDLLRVICRK